MPIQDVAVVRWVEGLTVGLVSGAQVALATGANVIGKVLAAEQVVTASVPVGQQNTPIIDVRGYTRAALWVPANFDGNTISIWTGYNPGFGVQALFDVTNTQVYVGSVPGAVAPSRNYDLPGEIAPWPYLLLSCANAQLTTATDFVLVLRTD